MRWRHGRVAEQESGFWIRAVISLLRPSQPIGFGTVTLHILVLHLDVFVGQGIDVGVAVVAVVVGGQHGGRHARRNVLSIVVIRIGG
jgi:hypothetical protein